MTNRNKNHKSVHCLVRYILPTDITGWLFIIMVASWCIDYGIYINIIITIIWMVQVIRNIYIDTFT